MNLANSGALLFESDGNPHVFLTEGSQLYGIPKSLADSIALCQKQGDSLAVDELLSAYGLDGSPIDHQSQPESHGLRALSLAVAQACNLGCTYCYAQGGAFGKRPSALSFENACASIDRLISEVPYGGRANIAFMGGEPLVNRKVIYEATEYCSGSMIPDTNVGGKITTINEVSDDQKATFFFS